MQSSAVQDCHRNKSILVSRAIELWSERNLEGFKFDKTELRPPGTGELADKAVLIVEHRKVVASFTAWEAGASEFIVLDGSLGQVLTSRDEEFDSEEELAVLLAKAMEELLRHSQK